MNSGSSLFLSIRERLAFVFTVMVVEERPHRPTRIPCASRAICWPSGWHRPLPPSPPNRKNQITGLIVPDFVRAQRVFGNKGADHALAFDSQPRLLLALPQLGLERLHGFCLTHGFATQG